jgi:acyl-CoA synthetase (AMP-forming)/AMP-acid ligase II
MAGGTVELHPKFDPHTIWSRWSDLNPSTKSTLFMAVPTVYSRLIDHFETTILNTPLESPAREGARSLRLMISGSAALPVSIKRRFHTITSHDLLERYGMTEIGMALSCGLDPSQRIDASVGWPLPGVSVRLVNPDTGAVINPSSAAAAAAENEAAPDPETETETEAGQIEIRGPNVFSEYFRQPAATHSTFTSDGWFKTGDIARRNSQGAYFILGRESVDLIKSGGYKISALEVERKILGNETLAKVVKEVVVVGVGDEVWGERVAAVVVLCKKSKSGEGGKEGQEGELEVELDLKMLRAALREDMAPYKIPSILKVVEGIERNAMGKVNKKEIVKKYF